MLFWRPHLHGVQHPWRRVSCHRIFRWLASLDVSTIISSGRRRSGGLVYVNSLIDCPIIWLERIIFLFAPIFTSGGGHTSGFWRWCFNVCRVYTLVAHAFRGGGVHLGGQVRPRVRYCLDLLAPALCWRLWTRCSWAGWWGEPQDSLAIWQGAPLIRIVFVSRD